VPKISDCSCALIGKEMLGNTTIYRLIVLIIPLFFLPAESYGIELRASWDYASSISGVAGFKLYMNGKAICETNDPAARELLCDVSFPFASGKAEFTITAFGAAGQESPPSESFTITFYPATSPSPPNGAVLPGDVDCNGIVDLKDLHLVEEILRGITPGQAVCLQADVNGDGKLGQEEINYILKHMTQVP
jgi:hypothetical protein